MIAVTLILFVAAAVFAFLWLDTRTQLSLALSQHQAERAVCHKHCARLAESDQFRHSVANSALRGCPAVKWHRPYPVPAGADAWYWRAMIAGEPHLFTAEVMIEARQRAVHLLPAGRSVSSTPPPTSCAIL